MQNLRAKKGEKSRCQARQTPVLNWEGWIDIMHASARENLNSGKRYFIFLDGKKACYNCQDEELYGAVLVLGHISRFWGEGELNFLSGWYVNVKELKLLSASGELVSIREHCPQGSLFEERPALE